MFASIRRVTTLLIAITLFAVPASAQDTRAEEIARKQEDKSKQLRPNSPTGTEKAIDWLENYFTDPDTVYLTFGGLYPSAGLAPGVAWRQAFGHARFNIGGAYSLRNYKLAHVSLPGLFDEARFTEASVFTAIDWRESSGYTRRGGLYEIALNHFQDSDDRFGFRRVDVEVQQYVPILKEHWVLAFRGLVQTTDVDEGQVVPYYLLPSLGGAATAAIPTSGFRTATCFS